MVPSYKCNRRGVFPSATVINSDTAKNIIKGYGELLGVKRSTAVEYFQYGP